MTKTPSKHPVRSLVVNALLVAVAFGLLGLAVWQNREQIRERLRAGGSTSGCSRLAFAIYLAGSRSRSCRWFALVRVIEPRFTLGPAFLLGFIGNVFNLVIPGAVGGDLIKAAYLVRMDINRTQAVASMVIDRILGLLGLFLLAGVAGAVAWPMASRAGPGPDRAGLGRRRRAGLLVLAMIFTQSLTRLFPRCWKGTAGSRASSAS